MMELTIAGLAHRASGITRRGSLLTLGGSALAATLAGQSVATAKKGKKRKAHLKRCKRQIPACEDAMRAICNPVPGCVLAELLPCCSPLSTCQAGESITCGWEYLRAL